MAKTASPCLDICKFRRQGPAGRHCIGCSMTKAQKALAKKAKTPKGMAAFVVLVMAQQSQMGGYAHWRGAYIARALKKGRPVPRVVREAS